MLTHLLDKITPSFIHLRVSKYSVDRINVERSDRRGIEFNKILNDLALREFNKPINERRCKFDLMCLAKDILKAQRIYRSKFSHNTLAKEQMNRLMKEVRLITSK